MSNYSMGQIRIDEQTAGKFKEGSMAAFEQVYNSTARMIYNVAYRIVLNEDDAKDITQETYVKAFNNRKNFNGFSDVSTWLYRIAANLAVNFSKKKRYIHGMQKILWHFFYHSDPLNDPAGTDDHHKEKELIINILSKINPVYRACLTLSELEGKSYLQIAEILGIKIGTVRSRINRGKKELKYLYEKEEKKHGLR